MPPGCGLRGVAASAPGALKILRGDFGFSVLVDLTALDLSGSTGEHPERFCVVYHLRHGADGARLRLKAWVSEEEPEIASVVKLWPGADWPEREVFDMFGIRFRGHPNLVRILTPDTYTGHPLRKDYPLRGRGERDDFPKYFEIPEE